jgi:hypothetical protein
MFVRVFNHIVYVVIPNILEVMREEALLRAVSEKASHPAGPWPGIIGAPLDRSGMVQVGVSGICASLRFIPLWAREIDAFCPVDHLPSTGVERDIKHADETVGSRWCDRSVCNPCLFGDHRHPDSDSRFGRVFQPGGYLRHGRRPLVRSAGRGLVGAIGPAMADALGFPQFILATAVVKASRGS